MIKNNILIVTRDISYPGGTEIFVRDFLKYSLGTKEKRLKFFLLETDGHAEFEKDVYQDLLNKGLILLKTVEPGDSFWSIKKSKQIQDIIKKYQIDTVHSFLFNSDFSVLLAKKGSDFVSKQLTINNVNLTPFVGIDKLEKANVQGLSFNWISSKFCSFSIALEEETEEWKLRKKIIDRYLEPIISKEANLITCVAKFTQRKWSKWVGSKKIKLIPCASIGKSELSKLKKLNKMKQILRKKFNLPKNSHVFITVSRLVQGKGLIQLVKAFKKYSSVNLNSQLLIIGDGELKNKLKSLIINSYNIKLLGFLPRKKIFEFLTASDFFCLFSSSEGLPLSIQEAMATGKVILASKAGGTADLVSNGVNGYLINKNDRPEILNIIKKAGSMNKGYIKIMSQNSRLIIEKKFIKEKVYKKLHNLYLQK